MEARAIRPEDEAGVAAEVPHEGARAGEAYRLHVRAQGTKSARANATDLMRERGMEETGTEIDAMTDLARERGIEVIAAMTDLTRERGMTDLLM